jgi:riboflavin kinase/FMN adenylyltransferase
MSLPQSPSPPPPARLRLRRGLAPARAGEPGWVAAIGTFDGLHLGHRALVARAIALASGLGLESRLLCFEPMPREVLHAQDPPARLRNFRERHRALQGCGLSALHLLAFNQRFRRLSGESFLAALQAAGLRHAVVGHDFRFGRDGQANADWLAAQGPAQGLGVTVIEPVLSGGERASSGLVREALAAADFARAGALLGGPYTMRGRVRRGQQLGRTLGFPTANLPLKRRRSPLGGIFAVRVNGAGLAGWPGVASLGTRPTVAGVEPLLEVHLFDLSRDLYGAELEVEFVRFLRPELTFDSLPALVAQMERDAADARAAL